MSTGSGCATCGGPVFGTIAFEVRGRQWEKDLCPEHFEDILDGTREAVSLRTIHPLKVADYTHGMRSRSWRPHDRSMR
jgi:hypothetical protein